jgi:hypothetical protein
MDHRYTGSLRLGWIRESTPLASPPHFSAVGGVHAGHNLHQSRFARTVLAQKKVDLAGINF